MMDQAQRLREVIAVLKEKRIKKEENKNRIVTITSGKGGVGKTTFTCNLAISLSNMGFRVLVIDADFGLSNVDVMLGVTVEHNLFDVLNNTKTMADIIAEGPNNIKIISGGTGIKELINISEDKIEQYINSLMGLENIADIILVDTGAGINDSVLKFILSSSEVILITTPEPTALMDAYALTKTVAHINSSINFKLVVNMAKNVKEAENTLDNFGALAKSFLNINIAPLGYLLDDNAVIEAVRLQEPFIISFPKSEVSNNIKKIAATFIEQPLVEKNKSGFQNFIKRLFIKN